MDSLVALANKPAAVTVVVFENDSEDGSRAAFRAWAERATYKVDLMECEEAAECKLKVNRMVIEPDSQIVYI